MNKNCYCYMGKETVYLQTTSEPRFIFVFIEKTWANLSLCIKPSDLYWNNTTVIQRTQGWIKGNFLFANIHSGSHMCNFLGVSQKECLLSAWPSQEGAELCFWKSLILDSRKFDMLTIKTWIRKLETTFKKLMGRNNLRAKAEQIQLLVWVALWT